MHFLNTKTTLWTVAVCLALLATTLQAGEAQPMAADPELEKKVMEVSEELRCLVCQNQTIADSDAGLAVDLKNQVRTMLSEGKSKEEINTYMTERYGDFVLYNPPLKPVTYMLWAGPFILLVLGLFVLYTILKNRDKEVKEVPLSDEESQRLQSILSDKIESENNKGGTS